MPELRWTLLLLGALFIAVLAWSERRKARQSTRTGHEPSIPDVPVLRPQREPTIREPTLREPALTLPEVRAREPSPPQDLPVVHVDDESLVGLRLDARSTPDPGVSDLPVLEAAETLHEAAFNTAVFGAAAETAYAAAEAADAAATADAAIEGVDAARGTADVAPRTADAAAETVDAARETAGVAPGGSAAPSGSAPIVEWPPEEDRRIIALRLVSFSPERFSGRAIRTALVAEGFVHGKYSIFHKGDAQQRAVLSAASLSKPGVFDLETIDSQRFSGLNLFAVLSASQSAREPFELLLACARNLNERLEGGLQDDRGGPLTPSRIAALRESLGAAPASFG